MLRLTSHSSWVQLAIVTLTVGCGISRRVAVTPYIPPSRDATLEELVARVNEATALRSLILRVDLQFETVENQAQGESRLYRTAQGRLILQRPEQIRLDIEAPILSANIAEMASDGERFQLLIHPPDYRALIEGSNDRSYVTEAKKLEQDPQLQKAGPLLNIRPQHFTDAFLLEPIEIGDSHFHEDRVTETDDRPGAKEGSQVTRSYYVVSVASRGERAMRTRYWFERGENLELRRLQVYDQEGLLTGDIRYSNYLPPEAETGYRFASEVRIDRPYDRYSLLLRLKKDGVRVNLELPETAFVVSAPADWGPGIRHIDLDQRTPSPPR